MAKLSDIVGIINKISPSSLAESWDNPGIQVGDPTAEITRVMVALDATPLVIESAIASACQLLVTHHPLIFTPQKSVSTATPMGRMIHTAIRGGLAIVAMHTNYDIAEGGLNDVLAERIGLSGCAPIQVTSTRELVKLVVFVPEDHLERVRRALLPFGEVLGAYRDCSHATSGEGTFTPQEGATPFIGTTGVLERVAERRLEVLIDRARLPRIVKALLSAHPYEEPAFDMYPLLNGGKQLGLGRIGRLTDTVDLATFAGQIGVKLSAAVLRYVGDPCAPVTKVAICSGSGVSLMRAAARLGADVLVTGDVKYHEARDAEALGISLVDAGHFSTEIIMVNAISDRLQQMLDESGYENCEILPCMVEGDPFKYINTLQ